MDRLTDQMIEDMARELYESDEAECCTAFYAGAERAREVLCPPGVVMVEMTPKRIEALAVLISAEKAAHSRYDLGETCEMREIGEALLAEARGEVQS